LISLTAGTARTIVYNSLSKSSPDDYDTFIANLKEHYKKTSSRNTRLLELSTITIKNGEKIPDFDVRFNTLCNDIDLKLDNQVITSYYILTHLGIGIKSMKHYLKQNQLNFKMQCK